MSTLTIGAAKAVLILAVAGGGVVQTAVIPTVWADLREVSPAVRLTVVVACVGWIACMQLVAGVALIMVVMRTLLRQAIEMRSELAEVV